MSISLFLQHFRCSDNKITSLKGQVHSYLIISKGGLSDVGRNSAGRRAGPELVWDGCVGDEKYQFGVFSQIENVVDIFGQRYGTNHIAKRSQRREHLRRP